MGLAGISKSTVSKLCKDIDDRVGAFLDRPLAGDWPYLWLDATYVRQREGGRIVSVAAIIAVAANTEGKREIVGLHIGPSEAEIGQFSSRACFCDLRGAKLVISDAHEGLKDFNPLNCLFWRSDFSRFEGISGELSCLHLAVFCLPASGHQ